MQQTPQAVVVGRAEVFGNRATALVVQCGNQAHQGSERGRRDTNGTRATLADSDIQVVDLVGGHNQTPFA